MSVLTGIHSTEGIVLAADSAAILGGYDTDTAMDSAKKIVSLGSILLGVAGSASVQQKFVDALTHDAPKDFIELRPVQAIGLIEDTLRQIIATGIAVATAIKGVHGPAALGHVLGEALIAVPSVEGPQLIKLDASGTGCHHQDLLFANIGEGQRTADPFMLWQKKVVWRNVRPNRARAILSAIWTIDYVVSRHPGSVAGEPVVFYLGQNSGEIQITEISVAEIDATRSLIADAEKACSDSFNVLDPTMVPEIPEIVRP